MAVRSERGNKTWKSSSENTEKYSSVQNSGNLSHPPSHFRQVLDVPPPLPLPGSGKHSVTPPSVAVMNHPRGARVSFSALDSREERTFLLHSVELLASERSHSHAHRTCTASHPAFQCGMTSTRAHVPSAFLSLSGRPPITAPYFLHDTGKCELDGTDVVTRGGGVHARSTHARANVYSFLHSICAREPRFPALITLK